MSVDIIAVYYANRAGDAVNRLAVVAFHKVG